MAIARSTDWTRSPAAPSSSAGRRTALAGPRSGPFLIASDLPPRAARPFSGGMLNQGVARRHGSRRIVAAVADRGWARGSSGRGDAASLLAAGQHLARFALRQAGAKKKSLHLGDRAEALDKAHLRFGFDPPNH